VEAEAESTDAARSVQQQQSVADQLRAVLRSVQQEQGRALRLLASSSAPNGKRASDAAHATDRAVLGLASSLRSHLAAHSCEAELRSSAHHLFDALLRGSGLVHSPRKLRVRKGQGESVLVPSR